MHLRIAVATLMLTGLGANPGPGQTSPILGAWSAEQYLLHDGIEHEISGHIFFDRHEWTVLFFVHDGHGTPRRGSAEGGTYILDGQRLVFTHQYHLSVGDALPGLDEAPLRLVTRPRGTGPEEASTVTLVGDHLTISFPSGNAMSFRRLSYNPGR